MNSFKAYLSILQGAVESFMQAPVVICCLFYLLIYRDLQAWILLGVVIGASALKYIFINLKYDMNTVNQFNEFIQSYPDYTFEKINAKSFIDQYGSYEHMRGILFQGLSDKEYVIVLLAKRGKSKKNLLSHKVFPRYFGPSIIVLRDIDVDRTISIWEQFKVFHEFGHLGKAHRSIETLIDHALYNVFLLFIVGIVIFNGTLLFMSFYCSLLLWYLSSYIGLYQYSFNKDNHFIERIADSFALANLCLTNEIATIEKEVTLQTSYGRENWNETMEFFLKWFIDPIDIKENKLYGKIYEHMKKSHSEEVKDFFINGISMHSVNYNSLMEKYCTPKFMLFVIMGACFLFGTITCTSQITLSNNLLLMVLFLLVPALFCLLMTRYTYQ